MLILPFPSHPAYIFWYGGVEQYWVRGGGFGFRCPCWIYFPFFPLDQLWNGCRLTIGPHADIWLPDPSISPLWPKPQGPPTSAPPRARLKTTIPLSLNHTSRCVYVCRCVLSRLGFHISCLKWNQKLGSWTGVLEACVWQRSNFAPWTWVHSSSSCFVLFKSRDVQICIILNYTHILIAEEPLKGVSVYWFRFFFSASQIAACHKVLFHSNWIQGFHKIDSLCIQRPIKCCS